MPQLAFKPVAPGDIPADFVGDPWEQQPREPVKWYNRLEQLRHLPINRRYMLTVYNAEREEADRAEGRAPRRPAKTLPESWRRAAQAWRWEARLAAWDNADRDRMRAELAEERKLNQQRRRAVAGAMLTLLARKVQALSRQANPDAETLERTARTMAAVYKESRLEFGDVTDIAALDVTSQGERLPGVTVDDMVEVFRQMRRWEGEQRGDTPPE